MLRAGIIRRFIVDFINHYLGEPVYRFEIAYTKPLWTKFFAKFGTSPDAVFGEYTPENAIPWYTDHVRDRVYHTVVAIRLFKGKLSEDDPTPGQLTLEAGFLLLLRTSRGSM